MLIGHTGEQTMLRETVRALMGEVSTEAAVRRLMESPEGYDPATWRRLGDLGLLGVAVPERFGGGGGSFTDQGVVLEEMGRALFCGPYFGTAVLATQTLLHLDDVEAAASLLRGICTGGLVVTLALTEESGRWEEGAVALRAERAGSDWRLSGTKTFVLDGAVADVILVVGRTAAGTSLFEVSADAPGLTRTPLPTMDLTRRQARLDIAAAPARLLGADGAAWSAVGPALQTASIALACEQVGGAQLVLDLVVAHAGTRHQFGRPIGSFQAVQHRCASLLVDIEAAKSAAYHGQRAVDAAAPDLAAVASLAKACCSETYRRTTNEAIQLVGGIGLTWDHPIHLYFKRALSSHVLLGTPADHEELLAAHLGL